MKAQTRPQQGRPPSSRQWKIGANNCSGSGWGRSHRRAHDRPRQEGKAMILNPEYKLVPRPEHG
jgi:hypothetical protein